MRILYYFKHKCADFYRMVLQAGLKVW